MGWCSATEIFDALAKALLDRDKPLDAKEMLLHIAGVLENNDWDCQHDSDYWTHPVVQEVFRELHPNWFEEE